MTSTNGRPRYAAGRVTIYRDFPARVSLLNGHPRRAAKGRFRTDTIFYPDDEFTAYNRPV
jgi:hypothetical protein